MACHAVNARRTTADHPTLTRVMTPQPFLAARVSPALSRTVRLATRARLAAFLTLVTAAGACGDGATEVRTFPLDVQVEYPATYATAAAQGARVSLVSVERNTTDTATVGADGVARFARVLPGSYTLSATRTLSETEAQTLTGIRTGVSLNATLPTQSFLAAPGAPVRMRLAGSPVGGLLIKEVYYTGSQTPSGGTYFSDQFIELYNNSTDTLYLDSLLIADVYGNSGQINPTSLPTPFLDDPLAVYASSIWMIPGTGRQRPLAPGGSVLIAQDGINHKSDPNGNPASPVDLSSAEWETYNERPDNRDLDAPSVPNLTRVYFTGGFDWLLTVFGPGVVIFRHPNPSALEQVPVPGLPASFAPRVRVPNGFVVDAFEAVQNASSGPYKRIPAALDGGFVFASGTYTSQSARRKVTATIAGRRVLQDTNNSTNDFAIISPPTPRGFGQ